MKSKMHKWDGDVRKLGHKQISRFLGYNFKNLINYKNKL